MTRFSLRKQNVFKKMAKKLGWKHAIIVLFVDSPENIQNFRLKDKRFTGISEDSERFAMGCTCTKEIKIILIGKWNVEGFNIKEIMEKYLEKISVHFLPIQKVYTTV